MEKAKLDWKTFTSRRRLDIRAWLSAKGITSLHQLKEWCAKKDMVPPTDEESKDLFLKPKKVTKTESVKPEPEPEEPELSEMPKTMRKKRTTKKVDEPSDH